MATDARDQLEGGGGATRQEEGKPGGEVDEPLGLEAS